MAVNKDPAPRWLLKNSRGQSDAMWTLTCIAFFVTTFAYVVSLMGELSVGETHVSFRSFDGLGYAAVVLVPLLGAYFGRRYTQEAQETSVAKAQIYAEVAKRRLDTGTKGVAVDAEAVDAEARAAFNLDGSVPKDEA